MWKGAESIYIYCRAGLNNSVYSAIYFYPKLRKAVSISEKLVTMKCVKILLCVILLWSKFGTGVRVLLFRFWICWRPYILMKITRMCNKSFFNFHKLFPGLQKECYVKKIGSIFVIILCHKNFASNFKWI